MPPLVITRDTISIHLHSEWLDVCRRGEEGDGMEERLRVPLHDVSRVVICGRPGVTLPVLHALMERNIPVCFVSATGRWLGALEGGGRPAQAARRICQYELHRDDKRRASAAAALVAAKIRNSMRVLQRFAAERGESRAPTQRKAVTCLRQSIRLALQRGPFAASVLRGIEGAAAAAYFRRLNDFFPPELPFVERTRQPPRNAANSILSWCYTVVLGEIETCLRMHHLDVGLGLFHGTDHSMPALALDLLEPLRAPLCDRLALHLLNHRILRPEHFRFCAEDGGTYLADTGKKLFFTAYEQHMTRLFTVKTERQRVTFRHVIDQQVCAFIRLLEHGETPSFFIMP